MVRLSVEDPRDLSVPIMKPGVRNLADNLFRILANNPSVMTLDGTNTYLYQDRISGKATVVDPGPTLMEHHDLILRLVHDLGSDVAQVLLTHGHPDHSALADDLAAELSSPLIRSTEAGSSPSAMRRLEDAGISVIPTPGHSSDSISYRTREAVLLTGDHLLGRGTTVILHPDGSLGSYLSSLRRIEELEFKILAPGHGPEMAEDLARKVIIYYTDHRLERIEQIEKLLEEGVRLVSEVVDRLYGSMSHPLLAWSARASTMATLTYLAELGRVTLSSDSIALNEI